MKKFLVIVVVLFLSGPSIGIFAQGYPVIDTANLLQAITQLYAVYDEINAAIEQVKNTYDQLQKQIKMVKNIDWDNLSNEGYSDNAWENIGTFRDNMKNNVRTINRNLNLVNALEDTVTKKKVRFGGKSYTLGGLLGVGDGASEGTTIFDLPKNLADYVEETADKAMAGYEGKLTYQQKAAIWSGWGLSPRNYAKLRLVEEGVNDISTKLILSAQGEHYSTILEEMLTNNESIMGMMTTADESLNAQMQVITQAILNLGMNLTRLEAGIYSVGAFLGQDHIKKEQEKYARARQKIIEFKKDYARGKSWTEMEKWW